MVTVPDRSHLPFNLIREKKDALEKNLFDSSNSNGGVWMY